MGMDSIRFESNVSWCLSNTWSQLITEIDSDCPAEMCNSSVKTTMGSGLKFFEI